MAKVQQLFAPPFIGVVLNCILYGGLLAQAYSYWFAYRDDSTWIKSLVRLSSPRRIPWCDLPSPRFICWSYWRQLIPASISVSSPNH
ncbi:hypothetical protein EDD85DRAFT_855885 [Armillaria nabsnona]|nr:hypothetical protein EDD85DRAFT_855885 [Armillaria nabsnona]